MYQGYIGTGAHKNIVFKLEKFKDAKHRAIVIAATSVHCGLIKDGTVVFHTNKQDVEYLQYIEQGKENNNGV